MNSVSSVEIAWRLESLYAQNVMTLSKYKELEYGCKRWFNQAFESRSQFNKEYLLTDSNFVNILSTCLGSERKMHDLLCICNHWVFWHFNMTIHNSIQRLKEQGADVFYLAPTSDAQFLKKFASMGWGSID